ncbi:LysR family transcriptional regulator [Pollutimonas sp. H1-120]|uniref:LysR family transcriptional regulator n=1 Tax=Pollutimonas sp. H1-120 TaxID=3148824 RepID=UPI003B519D81
MSPSLDDIALFVEVAKSRSFTRAAESLDMPASTLSRRISALERYIGVRLLNRSTRKVELTEAGAVYFERCQHVIAEARIAHEELDEMAQRPKGRLRISMPVSFALLSMPLIMRDFAQEYPEIECEYDLGIKHIDLLAEPFDIVIRIGHQPDSGVVSRRLGYVTLGLYAAPGYLARKGTPIVPLDLARHECLRTSAGRAESVWELRSQTRVEKITVKGRMAMNNVAMLMRMAGLGMGIVPLTAHNLTWNTEEEALQRVLPDWEFDPIPLMALFPSRLMPAKTRVFLEFLMARLNVR